MQASITESSDPEGVGIIRCRTCEQNNPTSRKFCTSCGTSLWEPCPQCDSPSAVGEKHCGVCGVDLATAAQKRSDLFQSQLQQVQELRDECRYDDAIARLEQMAKSDRRPAQQRAYLRELIRKVAEDRELDFAGRKEALADARRLADARDYQAAVRLLTGMARPRCNDEIQSLLSEMRSRVYEIESIERQLRDVDAEKAPLDLFQGLSRLLGLKPGHERAVEVGLRLAERCLLQADQLRKACRYEQAFRLVHQVPEEVRTDAIRVFEDEVAELTWLAGELRTSPTIDQTLLAVAQKLCRLAPDDRRAGKLRAELERRAETARQDSSTGVARWARRPAQSVVGCRVEWLTGFRRAECSEGVDGSLLARHPGCFYVAYGLALQGLSIAPIEIDLASKEGLGVVERASQAVRFHTARAAWGIDLSPAGLKAVKLSRKRKEDSVWIEDVRYLEHRKVLGEAINPAERQTVVAETLSEFLADADVASNRVCVGLPGTLVLSRDLRLPPMDAKKLARAIHYEVVHQVPFHPRDLVWDYHRFTNASSETSSIGRHDVMVVAAKREQVKEYLERFRQAKVPIDIVQTDCLALYNAVAYEHFGDDVMGENASGTDTGEKSRSDDVVGVLDVGSETSNLVIGSGSCVWFRTIGLGSHSITRALAREFRMTLAEAEKLKRAPAEADRLHTLYEAVEPVLKNLVEEIHRSLAAFKKIHPQCRLERLLVLGGGLRFHGLLGHCERG